LWSTSSENNTSHFEIEKSDDGKNYLKIGQVQTKGSASTEVDYSFIDLQPLKTNFYRLKIVENDKSFKLSKTIVVKKDELKKIALQIFPNPVNDVLQINLSGLKPGAIKMNIIDASGRIITEKKMTITDNSYATFIETGNLIKGLYFIRVDGINETASFIKN
jgi:hypothetical protein